MIIDLSAFSGEKFDPKKWINDACATRPEDEPVDKYLSEMEMKLQLLAEDIASSLEDLSSSSLLRVPRAVRETNRVKDDASSLRQTVAGILQRISQVEDSSAQCVSNLSRIDSVKHHMEAARDTLQDAAGLAQLRASVEDVFASGDLPKVAETLYSMRKCLAVVGEVPEFADMKRQLASLEDRLEQMVQPRLADAIYQKKVEDTQSLREILFAIGRYSALEEQYVRVRIRPIKKLWDDLSNSSGSSPFSDWLPRFYDEVLLTVEGEILWCERAFPLPPEGAGEGEGENGEKTGGGKLVLRLLTEAMAAISSGFMDRLDEAVEGDGGTVLTRLISLHSLTATFARNLQRQLAGSTAELAEVVLAVLSPYEGYKMRYGQLEQSLLSSQLSSLDLKAPPLRGGGGRGVQLAEAVAKMEASISPLLSSLENSLQRCLSLTGGSEAESLISALDASLQSYLAAMASALISLRPLCGLSSQGGSTVSDSTVEEEEEWALVQGVLQLLALSEALASRAAVFEASLKGGIARLAETILGPPGEIPELDPAVLRLVQMPEKVQRLSSLVDQAGDPRFRPLPRSFQKLQSFQEEVSSLVFEVLTGKVKRALQGFREMPVWGAEEEKNAFDLPNFSAYAETYVTVIGEYLLQLPQQLLAFGGEIGAGEGGGEEEQNVFAADWMFKVAEGATSIYVEELKGLTFLSERGARQLHADLEYFCNVLDALSMATPPVLATFLQCLLVGRLEFKEFILREGGQEGNLDLGTVKLIAKLRKIPLE